MTTEVNAIRSPNGKPRHPLAIKAYEYLKSRSERGAIVTDEELSKELGCDVRSSIKAGANTIEIGPGYKHVRTARKMLLKYDNVQWGRLNGAGAYECRTSSGCILDMGQAQRRVRRIARKGVYIGKAINIEELDSGARSAALVKMAHLGTIAALSSASSEKKLAARNVVKPLDMSKLLESLK